MSVENLHTEKKFSFSGVKSSVIGFVNSQLRRFEKKSPAQEAEVNNYFKSPEQMEVDFSLEMSAPVTYKESTAEEIYLMAIHQSQRKDGYINIPDLVNMNAGFLEENY